MDPSASASSSRRTLSPEPPASPPAYQGDTDEAGPTQLQLSLLSRGDWGTSASGSSQQQDDVGGEGIASGSDSSGSGWQELSDSDRRSSARPPLFPLRRRQDQHQHHHSNSSASGSGSSTPPSPSPPFPPQDPDPDPRDWSYRTNLIDPPSPHHHTSSSTASYDSDSDSDESDSEWSTTTSQYVAEQEAQLREAFEQLELAFKCILCPVVGKMLGRWGAYWAFRRYTHHGGLTLRFFGLSWVPETKIPSWLAVLFLPMTAGGE